MGKQVITASDIEKLSFDGNTTLDICEADCIITPGARDKMEELGIDCCKTGTQQIPGENNHSQAVSSVNDTQVNQVTDQVCTLLQQKLGNAGTPGLADLVKKIVQTRLSDSNRNSPKSHPEAAQPSALVSLGGVSLIDGNQLLDECSGPDVPGKVLISDAIRCHEASHLTATYMKWEKTSFSRTVDSPEINIILEGELNIVLDDKTLNAKAGDMIYMAKGASVTYDSPSGVKLACVN